MKAVLLLSGGLDSTALLARAVSLGLDCYALSFDYGQRHQVELEAAAQVAHHFAVPHTVLPVRPPAFAQSALTKVPLEGQQDEPKLLKNRRPCDMADGGIPSSYVPARNTLFLAYAMGHAELLEAQEIHLGANLLDYEGYPDCRPEYFSAFQRVLNLGSKQAVEGQPPQLVTPFVQWDKPKIISAALDQWAAPLHLSFSCYDPQKGKFHCGTCDACVLRKAGFALAGKPDPTPYLQEESPHAR